MSDGAARWSMCLKAHTIIQVSWGSQMSSRPKGKTKQRHLTEMDVYSNLFPNFEGIIFHFFPNKPTLRHDAQVSTKWRWYSPVYFVQSSCYLIFMDILSSVPLSTNGNVVCFFKRNQHLDSRCLPLPHAMSLTTSHDEERETGRQKEDFRTISRRWAILQANHISFFR